MITLFRSQTSHLMRDREEVYCSCTERWILRNSFKNHQKTNEHQKKFGKINLWTHSGNPKFDDVPTLANRIRPRICQPRKKVVIKSETDLISENDLKRIKDESKMKEFIARKTEEFLRLCGRVRYYW